jgi:DNA polymerase
VTPAERGDALSAIADEVRVCRRCRLADQRTNAVPGEGSPDTEVVFVGEGPGFNEDQQGRPFVGAAGTFLDELIGAVGWRRPDVFITNVVKCRPPGNRDPEPDEMAACAPFLRRQLEVLDPALVVTLGRFSLGTFMPGTRISQVHGTVRPVEPGTGARMARAFAMYHPAAALRQGALKETMRDDMSRIPAALIAARHERAEHLPPEVATEGIAPAEPGSVEPEADEPIVTPAVAEVVSELGPRGAPLEPDAEPVAAEPTPMGSTPMTDRVELGPEPEAAEPSSQLAAIAPPIEAFADIELRSEPPITSDLEGALPAETLDTLEALDTLAPLEVLGVAHDHPPETDQMRLF